MKKLEEFIVSQIESNRGKNLFYKEINKTMEFKKPTLYSILHLGELTPSNLNLLIDYTTEKVLQEFCRANQYFSFKEKDKSSLNTIYWNLYHSLIEKSTSIDIISQAHYENLKAWLAKTNPFSREMYREKKSVIKYVACSEYSAFLQKNILQLNNTHLIEPILDIGCGKAGYLVEDLRKNKFEAYGIERFSSKSQYIEKADWLEFDYGIEKWGTIVSNLGFSNHFIHNHLREDGNFIEYADKYTKILKSLKIGGSFHYAPDLPFIEKYFDKNDFSITKYDIENLPFKITIIKRLR